jgi:RNA polymerase sigma-70 factor (ECF subfamily)
MAWQQSRAGSGAPDDPPDDAALLGRVRARDAAAHRLLFERYQARVYGFVQRRLRDAPLAEEVVADVFFEVWRSADRYRGDAAVPTWIFGIAHFKCLRASRDRRRRGDLVPDRAEAFDEVADERDSVESLTAREELRRVRGLVRALPEPQRETVELALIQGLEYEEVAERLGVTEATVKTRISRARAALRRHRSAMPRPARI